jgi:hypothetical protein
MHEEKRAFQRFLRAIASRCDPFRSSAKSFIGGISAMRNVFRLAGRVAKYGSAEICGEPLAGLARQAQRAARGSVSIGKKTVGRASRAPV